MTLRMVLADDHADALEILSGFIRKNPSYEIAAVCENGEELIEAVAAMDVHLILTDISMPKLNGVDAVKAIRAIKPDVKIIFTTSYDEHAVEAFQLNATDYLVKPIERPRLYEALEKASLSLASRTAAFKRLMIRSNGSNIYLDIDDILFIEKIGKKCAVYTEAETFHTYDTIRNLLEQLDPARFFMSHRSYIINLSKVHKTTAKNETFLIHFWGSNRHAHLSKLKVDEFHKLFN